MNEIIKILETDKDTLKELINNINLDTCSEILGMITYRMLSNNTTVDEVQKIFTKAIGTISKEEGNN